MVCTPNQFCASRVAVTAMATAVAVAVAAAVVVAAVPISDPCLEVTRDNQTVGLAMQPGPGPAQGGGDRAKWPFRDWGRVVRSPGVQAQLSMYS